MSLLSAMIKLSGRPWWQARYRDGKVISEWDTAPGVARLGPLSNIWGKSRWEDIKKAGMVGLRMLTPEGMAAELEALTPEGSPLDQRFIQLRQTGRDFALMPGAKNRRYLIFQLIGVVGDDGTVQCHSYEVEPHAYVLDFATLRCSICRLPREKCAGRDVVAVKTEELREWAPDPRYPQAVNRERVTNTDLHGERHPIVSFTDDVYNMRYRGLGAINLELQGVKL